MSTQMDALINAHLSQVVGLPDVEYTAVIAIGTYQFEALRVIMLTEKQNYVEDMFEEIMITVAMTSNQYLKAVNMGHEDMSLTLITKGWETNLTSKRTYRAILVNQRDERLEGNMQEVHSLDEADNKSLAVVTLQLIDPAAYNLRLKEIGGIFRNCDTMSVLKYCLASARLYDVFSKSNAIASISADDTYQTATFKSVVIPEGTKILQLPDFLHNTYGVFNQGMGCYLKNRCWYIFAPYNVLKFEKNVDKLVLINVPPTKYRSLAANFKLEGKTTTILCTGETRHMKQTSSEALNLGTGVKYADTAQLMTKMSNKDGSPKLRPKEYITEYRSSNYMNANNLAPMIGYEDNPAKQASYLAARGGDYVTLTWERGTMDVLVPGMPVKFITDDTNGVRVLYGTLLAAEKLSNAPQGGMVETRHTVTIKLVVFLKSV